MAKKREYEWFLEPCGDVAYTNNILSKNIGEENALQDVLCQDGKMRNLWRCSSALILMLWSSRKNFGKEFKIKIFCKEGKGMARDITSWYKNRNKRKRMEKRSGIYRGKL